MNTLLDFGGLRVNYSVFECMLPIQKLTEMKKAIYELIDKDKDNVRYYTICESCIKLMDNQGVEPESATEGQGTLFV